MQRTIRLLRMLPDPEVPPAIAANVMRRIRLGETRPSLIERLGRIVSSVLEPTFVLPASAMAIAALVVMVVQDPSLGSRLGVWPLGEDTRAAVVEPSRGPAPGGRLARVDPQMRAAGSGVGTGEGRAFGAPAAREFRVDSEQAKRAPARAAARPNAVRQEIRIEIAQAPAPGLRAEPGRMQRRPGASAGGSLWADAIPVAQSGGQTVSTQQAAPLALAAVEASEAPELGRVPGSIDPRDEYLAEGLASPVEFARFLSAQSLAEQELWVSRLAARAEARGLLDELVDALRGSGDPAATLVADDFAAEAQSLRVEAAAADAGTPSP